MPMGMTTRNQILDNRLRGVALTAVATVYAQLHSGDPGTSGTANVIAGPARQTLAFANAASNGSISNTGVADFAAMPASTVTWVSLWDAATAGICLWYGPLSEAVTVVANDTFSLGVGDVIVTQT